MKNQCRYTKKELAIDIKITSKRLTKELITLEPELLEKFPYYSRNCQILSRQVYKYILEQIGTDDPTEVKEILARPRSM